MNKWNNKFRYQVASCWLFVLSHTTIRGSMNIKLKKVKFAPFPPTLPESINISIKRIIILPAVFVGMKFILPHYGRNVG